MKIQMMVAAVYEKAEKELSDEDKKKLMKTFEIDKASDSLDLSDVSEQLCINNAE